MRVTQLSNPRQAVVAAMALCVWFVPLAGAWCSLSPSDRAVAHGTWHCSFNPAASLSTFTGAACTLECNDALYPAPVGNTATTCQASGQWSPAPGHCAPVAGTTAGTCPPLPQGDDGAWRCPATIVDGSTCDLTCTFAKRFLVGSSQATCSNGVWLNKGYCVSSGCGVAPALPAHAQRWAGPCADAKAGLADGATCAVECASGYAASTDGARCVGHTWQSVPTCAAAGPAVSGPVQIQISGFAASAAHHTDMFRGRQEAVVRRGRAVSVSVLVTAPAPANPQFRFRLSANQPEQACSVTKGPEKRDARLVAFTVDCPLPPDAPIGRARPTLRLEATATSAAATAPAASQQLLVLFDPWGAADAAAMPAAWTADDVSANLLDGQVPVFFADGQTMAWRTDHTLPVVLDVALTLLETYRFSGDLSSAREVTRFLANAISTYVIEGNWNYRTGHMPAGTRHASEWRATSEIFSQFVNTNRRIVKYGQCWVFGSLLASVMRALGVPARVITVINPAFTPTDASGEHSLEMKFVYDRTLSTQLYRDGTTFNFHTWADVYMNGKWWATDPTQQMGGPARLDSVRAHQLHVAPDMDTDKFYSYVNGVEAHYRWLGPSATCRQPNGFQMECLQLQSRSRPTATAALAGYASRVPLVGASVMSQYRTFALRSSADELLSDPEAVFVSADVQSAGADCSAQITVSVAGGRARRVLVKLAAFYRLADTFAPNATERVQEAAFFTDSALVDLSAANAPRTHLFRARVGVPANMSAAGAGPSTCWPFVEWSVVVTDEQSTALLASTRSVRSALRLGDDAATAAARGTVSAAAPSVHSSVLATAAATAILLAALRLLARL